MDQDIIFAKEGAEWLRRNKQDLPIKDDLVLGAFDQLIGGLGADSRVVEVGCSNGWRLQEIGKRYAIPKRRLWGIDPSRTALKSLGRDKGFYGCVGTARDIPFEDDCCDVLIYGFCLYLCNREDLFLIAKEGNRVLSDGGLLVVYDFATPMPCKTAYKHKEGVWSYKQDYENLWLASPAYTKVIDVHSKDGQTKAVVLRKKEEFGWPLCE